MTPLLQEVMFDIGNSHRGWSDIEGTIGFGKMSFMVSQGTVHTLTKAAQAWMQVRIRYKNADLKSLRRPWNLKQDYAFTMLARTHE